MQNMCELKQTKNPIAHNDTVFPEGTSEPSGPTNNVAVRGQQPVRQDYLCKHVFRESPVLAASTGRKYKTRALPPTITYTQSNTHARNTHTHMKNL